MHGGSRSNQQYKRSPLQLANLAAQKRKGMGARFVPPRNPPPETSWWICSDEEFPILHAQQVPRMTAVTTTYRFAHPDDF